MQREFCWPHMANNVHTIVSGCISCAQIRVDAKLKRQLQLFPASGPIESVTLDILAPLLCSVDGS